MMYLLATGASQTQGTEMRTWTAEITAHGETFAAENSTANLKADQLKAAAREAGEYLEEGDDAKVELYKTTKTHGTVSDVSRLVVRHNGELVIL